MRTMLKWTMPVETGNRAIKDGSIARVIEALSKELKPEAAYFWPENGKRTAMMVFDMADPSDIARIAEQLFLNLDAAVQFTPVMNSDDLKKGLSTVSS